MKYIITLFSILVLAACTTTTPEPPNYFENQHYTVLNTQKSDEPVVTQYFSFYCPHCKNLEPMILELKPHLVGEAKYEKNPVFFMGYSMAQPMARAHATMVLLDKEDELVTPMFELAQGSNSPSNEQDIRNFFISHGVNGDQFDDIYNSDKVTQMVNTYRNKANTAPLTGVPTIIVNNKYDVDLGTFLSLDSDERNELIDYLLTL